MKTIQVAICDSCPNDRNSFATKCRQWSIASGIPMQTRLYEGNNFLLYDVERTLKDDIFDILLLEVDESNSGIYTAQKLRSLGYIGQIIFLANSNLNDLIPNSRVLEIFDVYGTYVLKNSLQNFEHTLRRVVSIVQEETTEYVLYNRVGEYRQIALHDIRYFDVHKNLVCVHYEKDEKFEFMSTLAKVSTQLCERGFFRIHRLYVVSLSHVRRLTYEGVTLSCGTQIPIGRSYYASLKTALYNHRRHVGMEVEANENE